MADSQQYPDSGLLFINKDHAAGDKKPSMKGTARVTINGAEYQLDLVA